MQPRRLAAVLIAACAILGLSACTAEPSAVDLAVSPSPTVATPSAPTTEPGPSSTPTPHPSIVPMVLEADEQDCYQQVLAVENETERLGPWRLEVPRDRGEKGYAHGTAEYDATGVPVAYTVAANDNIDMIPRRFCITPAYLHVINHVRRGDGELYVGDTVNLDAHTMLTVGDRNGMVTDNPLPADLNILPQR